MSLLSDELVVYAFDNLVLTNHRIRKYDIDRKGKIRSQEMISIMIKHVTHCQTRVIDDPALLVFSFLIIVASLVGGVQMRNWAIGVVGILIGIILLIAYYKSRRVQIVVSSPTATIKGSAPLERLSNAIALIDALEQEASAYPHLVKQQPVVEQPTVVEKPKVVEQPIVVEQPTLTRRLPILVPTAPSRRDVDYWGG